MSFARFAIRHATVQALKGATLVGENIRNSDFQVFDIAADGSVRGEADQPFVLVYTDDGKDGEPGRFDLWANGAIDLVFEFGIALAMTETDSETGASVITGTIVPATDPGMEETLDLLDRQIAAALHGDSEWADLFRSLFDGQAELERKRVTLDDRGTRMAARQIRVALQAKRDPVYGEPLAGSSVWWRFADAVEGTDAEATTAALLGTPGAEVTWDVMRARHGLTRSRAAALHLAPADRTRPDAMVAGHEITDQ